MTRGAEDEVRHRYVRLDLKEEFIDAAKPLYFALTGEWTKRSGYARLLPAADAKAIAPATERLVWLDKGVGRLIKARDADFFAYVVQDFDDSPDYFVAGPPL